MERRKLRGHHLHRLLLPVHRARAEELVRCIPVYWKNVCITGVYRVQLGDGRGTLLLGGTGVSLVVSREPTLAVTDFRGSGVGRGVLKNNTYAIE